MTRFCTVADVKRYVTLGRNVTSDVALLETLIDGATAAIETYTNRSLLLATYTEIRDGTGNNTLVLANYPIVSVSSVSLGLPGVRTSLTVNTEYIATRTALRLVNGGAFPRGVANVAITYTAGYTTLPADIIDACAKWSALKYRQLERLGQLSKTLAGETVTFDTAAMPNDVKLTLDNYKRTVQLSSQGAS